MSAMRRIMTERERMGAQYGRGPLRASMDTMGGMVWSLWMIAKSVGVSTASVAQGLR